MQNNKKRFFYVLYSDKTWVFDQSKRTQGPISAQSKCAGSWLFGHLQQNICRLLHTCQTCIQERLPLLPITIASLPATQKHFDWAAIYILIFLFKKDELVCKVIKTQNSVMNNSHRLKGFNPLTPKGSPFEEQNCLV